MESKEALERLKTHIVLLEQKVGIDNTSVNPYAVDYALVEKDLKVLEILKNHLFEQKIIIPAPYKANICLLGSNEITNTNEIKLIKEWLEK